MAAIKFDSSGNIKLDSDVEYVKGRIQINWNDAASKHGIALNSLSFPTPGGRVEWARDTTRESGSVERSFTITNQFTTVDYASKNCPLRLTKEDDGYLSFRDNDGDDKNARVYIRIDEVKRIGQPSGLCAPGPWSQPTPPSCGFKPTALSSTDGLQITETGQNEITLNLKNYANKLVSLRITHQVNVGTAWAQRFDFNIPTCSDISPDPGGTPYAKSGYSNSNISGTNIFYVYNIDGGDYNYKFTSSSIPGPAPWRQLYTQVCVEREEGPPLCDCVPAGIETFSPWPYCPTGVAISKNGGNKVQWQYESGGGGNYDDQFITVEVIGIRNAVEAAGSVCSSALKSNVWVPDSLDPTATGNCIGDYKDHSEKIRFRIPSLQQSKTSLPAPVRSSAFRGIAGAIPPTEQLGSVSSEYSVLHLFNRYVYETTSLVVGNGITVSPNNEEDTYISPYNEADPSSNTNLGTTNRNYYLVTFTDGTIVSPGASNISISIGQNVTADGLNTTPVVFKKEQVNANSLRVWFYINYKEDIEQTDDIIHVFDDTTNTTDEELSELIDGGVTVVPQATTDPGNQTAGYETLNATNKKHYLVTFTDSTIVNSDASNISFTINQNKTASGDVYSIKMVKRERVNDKSMRVWFTSYNTTNPAGLETDNSFVRDFSVYRLRSENFSGNTFVRNWYLSKET
jgi:hypothetical protein